MSSTLITKNMIRSWETSRTQSKARDLKKISSGHENSRGRRTNNLTQIWEKLGPVVKNSKSTK